MKRSYKSRPTSEIFFLYGRAVKVQKKYATGYGRQVFLQGVNNLFLFLAVKHQKDKLLWLLKNKKKNNIVNTYKMWGAAKPGGAHKKDKGIR